MLAVAQTNLCKSVQMVGTCVSSFWDDSLSSLYKYDYNFVFKPKIWN